jgi:hypothetical protein
MRTTREIREKLEAAAEKSGRSLAQETEYRIGRSFEIAELGDRGDVMWMARLFAIAIDMIEQTTGKRWTDDRKTYDEVKAAFATIMESNPFMGLDEPTAPDSMGRVIARLAVKGLLSKEVKR